MNSREIDDIHPGQLFQLWSGHRRGLVIMTFQDNNDKIVTRHITNGTYLLFVKPCKDSELNSTLLFLKEAIQILNLEHGQYYEFLMNEKIVILTRSQLAHLAEAY